jgi:hypothetical protein
MMPAFLRGRWRCLFGPWQGASGRHMVGGHDAAKGGGYLLVQVLAAPGAVRGFRVVPQEVV